MCRNAAGTIIGIVLLQSTADKTTSQSATMTFRLILILSYALVTFGFVRRESIIRCRSNTESLRKCDSTGKLQMSASPSLAGFKNFFTSKSHKNNLITKKKFFEFPGVVELLDDGRVSSEDAEDLWYSVASDKIGVTEYDAYDILNIIKDMPDQQEIEFLDREFSELVKSTQNKKTVYSRLWSGLFNKKTIDFGTFWEWRQTLDASRSDQGVSQSEFVDIYESVADDISRPVTRSQFGKINTAINDMLYRNNGNRDLDSNDEGEGEDEGEDEEDGDEYYGISEDLKAHVDYVFRPTLDPKRFIDKALQEECLTLSKNTQENHLYNMSSLLSISSVKRLLEKGFLGYDDVEDVWDYTLDLADDEQYHQYDSSSGSGSGSEWGVDEDHVLRILLAFALYEDECTTSPPSFSLPPIERTHVADNVTAAKTKAKTSTK